MLGCMLGFANGRQVLHAVLNYGVGLQLYIHFFLFPILAPRPSGSPTRSGPCSCGPIVTPMSKWWRQSAGHGREQTGY